MESELAAEARESLRAAERAAAAPYLDPPKTPAWYPPVAGAWATGFTALALFDAGRWDSIARTGLVAVVALFLLWYRRVRGTMPSMRNVPAEFRSAFAQYFIGVGVLIVGWLAAAVWLPVIGVLAFSFVSVTLAVLLWERRYARAAAETRARLW